ncbi:C25 family cysteine peptidase [uncultured Ilyobacter sp.]|uniref:C25 family cysteine peptidase n=1 Tax=uncultured Ilyobacter sp. TaxID=544433 RepID=UPI0029F50076|nr:C25 family cysteine peptidase [uncultured Ilyobacter sp.]
MADLGKHSHCGGDRTASIRALAIGFALTALLATTALAGNTKPAVNVNVEEDTADYTLLSYRISDVQLTPIDIDGAAYDIVQIEKEAPLMIAGAPDLPQVSRSIIIGDDAAVAVEVLASEYYDIPDVDIAPSRGSFSRTIDPATVPYEFGPAYDVDAFYPNDLAELSEPYILRDVRGVVVHIRPVQYNAVTRTLRVYTDLTVRVLNTEDEPVNPLVPRQAERALSLAFNQVYRHQFLNYSDPERYSPLDEQGEMLVICYDSWMSNMQPFVEHKNDIGITCSMVGVSTIGNSSTAIKSYIQNEYNTSDLAFVLLVGDSTQIATPYASGGSSDPTYSTLAGSDSYPDIFVGRFSAENSSQVDTQVERTIEYETMPATEQAWFKKGVGIGSSEGAGIGDDGESDTQHIGNIRTDLLNYDYTSVDGFYGSVSASQVSTAINAGRGIINYCGHGSTYSWSTSGFSTSNVNALTNDNMLPFIVSVACVNGQFAGYTCFAEAWLRATHNGEPTGAIGIYASSVNQDWAPPMAAQDETVDLLVDEAYFSFGALCFAGSCQMMDEYGSSGVATFNTWHIFGDPSVRVFGVAEPPTGMKVTGDNFASSGDRGGPFSPESFVYELENKNETPIDFEVTADVAWLDIDTPSGTLPALGTAQVTVTLNDDAYTLLHGVHEGAISFVNATDHDGDEDVAAAIDVDDMDVRISFPLDSNPGWTKEGDWGFGTPMGGGSRNGDPAAAYSGTMVYGYNLTGDYAANMDPVYLTTAAFDCSNLGLVELRFQRWLGVERYDTASIQASSNGVDWTTIWTNPTGGNITDYAWTEVAYDISAVADGQSTVYVRWGMGPTDSSNNYPGWNLDDVEIWGVLTEAPVLGDLDGDGDVDLSDLQILLGYYGTIGGVSEQQGDLNGDNQVDLADLQLLLGNYGYGG